MPKNRTLIKSIAVMILALAAVNAQASKPYQPIVTNPLLDSWRWRSFAELRGKGLKSMTEAPDGTMWFGVHDGIIHYDGLQWTYYTADDGIGLISANILSAATDGKIYAAKRGINDGLPAIQFANGIWQRLSLWEKNTIAQNPDFSILGLHSFADGSTWAATTFGALRIRNDGFTFFTSKSALSDISGAVSTDNIVLVPDRVSLNNRFSPLAIHKDKQGFIWFAVKNGLVRFDDTQPPDKANLWNIYKTGKQWDDRVFRIYQTKDKVIWIINDSAKDKVNRFDPLTSRWKTVDLLEYGGTNLNYSIFESEDGTIWISGHSKIHALQNGSWQVYDASEVNLPIGVIYFHQSRDGSLWIGVRDSEVFRVDLTNKRWSRFNDLHFQCETADKRLWFIGKDGRVVVYNPSSTAWRQYDTSDGLISMPLVLFTTEQEKLVAAGSHNGQAASAIYNGNRWQKQIYPLLGKSVEYRSAHQSSDGYLWFGSARGIGWCNECLGGLIQLNINNKPATWSHIRPPAVRDRITGIIDTANGQLWYGSREGVFRYNGESSRRAPKSKAIPPGWTDDVHAGADGSIWVVKGGVGLLRYYKQNWLEYNVDDGLVSNMVSSIVSQADGTAWAATNKGISRFDGKHWVTQVLPEDIAIDRESGTLKQTSDGALWINRASREWYFRVQEPEAYLKTSKERPFNSIRYIPDRSPPETTVTAINKENDSRSTAYFSWQGFDLWETTPNENLQYSYRIDNSEWSVFSSEQQKDFSSIEPGEYFLEVRARDLDLNIDPTPAQAHFTIVPPLWQRLWFLAAFFLLATTISLITIRNYTNRNKKLERLRRRLNKAKKKLHKQDVELIKSREDSFKLASQIEDLNKIELNIDFHEKRITDKSGKEFELTSLAKNNKNEIFDLLEFIQRWDKNRIHLIEFGFVFAKPFLKAIDNAGIQDYRTKGKFGRIKYGINKTFRVNCGKELILNDDDKIHVYFKQPHNIAIMKSDSGDLTISKESIDRFDRIEIASFSSFEALDYYRINTEIVIHSSVSESQKLLNEAIESEDINLKIEKLEHAVDLDNYNYDALRLLMEANIFKYADLYRTAKNSLETQIGQYSDFLHHQLNYDKNRLNLELTKKQYKEIYGTKLIPKEKLRDFKTLAEKASRQIIKYEKSQLRQRLKNLKGLDACFGKYDQSIEALRKVIEFFKVGVNPNTIAKVVAKWVDHPELYRDTLINGVKKSGSLEEKIRVIFLQTTLDFYLNDKQADLHIAATMIDYFTHFHTTYPNHAKSTMLDSFLDQLGEFFSDKPEKYRLEIEGLFTQIREPIEQDDEELSVDQLFNHLQVTN